MSARLECSLVPGIREVFIRVWLHARSVCACPFHLQEHAFEPTQKYKEGKFIVEKARVLKEGDW
jgi:hypothetical protein